MSELGARSGRDLGSQTRAARRQYREIVEELLGAALPAEREGVLAAAFRGNVKRLSGGQGEVLVDPLGGPYDFIWVSQILHMLPDREVERIVGVLTEALTPEGVLAVHEHFLDDAKDGPLPAALFGVHMLAVTPGGRAYSFGEIEALMRGAGLTKTERVDYGAATRILLGRR